MWNLPYFGDSMPKTRFYEIHLATRLRKDKPPTTFRDKFWHIWELIKAFNDKMGGLFGPLWLTCLDESMVIFLMPFALGG